MSNLNIRRLRSAVNWVETQAALPVRRRRWRQKDWWRDLTHRTGRPYRDAKNENIARKRSECQTLCCVAGYLVERFRPDVEISPDGFPYDGSGRRLLWDHAALDVLGLDRSDPAFDVLAAAFLSPTTTAPGFRRAAEKAAALSGKTL